MLRRLASQTATYGLTSILGRLIGNLLLPLQTGRLSLHDFSVLQEVLAYSAVLAVVFPLGLETALFKFSNDTPESKEVTEDKIITLQILVALLFLPASWFWLQSRLPEIGYVDGVVICCTLAIDSITSIFLSRIRNRGESVRFLVVKLGSIGFIILFNLLFLSEIAWFDAINPIGVNFRLIIYINFLAAVFVLFLMPGSLARYRWVVDHPLFKKVLRFSLPILLMSIIGVSNDIFGRIWLETLTPAGFYPSISNKDLIGIYSGCAKIAIFINLGIQAYRYAADPFFFGIQDKKDTATYLAQSFTWFSAIGLLAFVAIASNLDLIVHVFLRKPEFRLGLEAIYFLLLANFFFGVYYNLSFWYKFADRTYWGSMISVIGLTTNALLNIVLVPVWGMTGSGIALLLCYLVMCGISLNKGKAHFPVQWDYGRFVALLSLALGLVILGRFWEVSDLLYQLVKGITLPILFLSFVIWVQKESLFKRFQIESSGPNP